MILQIVSTFNGERSCFESLRFYNSWSLKSSVITRDNFWHVEHPSNIIVRDTRSKCCVCHRNICNYDALVRFAKSLAKKMIVDLQFGGCSTLEQVVNKQDKDFSWHLF